MPWWISQNQLAELEPQQLRRRRTPTPTPTVAFLPVSQRNASFVISSRSPRQQPTWLTDELSSYELGVKSDLYDGTLRLNAAWYITDIDDLQVSRFDPSNVAFLYFIENVGDAESNGLDVDFQWLATDSLTFAGAFSYLDTELTRLNPQLQGVAAPVGAELPLAPRFCGNLRAQYDFSLDGLEAAAYVRASVNYRGTTVSGVVGSAEFMDDTLFRQSGYYSGLEMQDEGGTFGTVEIRDGSRGSRLPYNSRFVNPTALTVSLAFGVARDGWTGELFVDNATNEDAQVLQIAGHYTPVVSEQRPRSVGLRFSYRFE